MALSCPAHSVKIPEGCKARRGVNVVTLFGTVQGLCMDPLLHSENQPWRHLVPCHGQAPDAKACQEHRMSPPKLSSCVDMARLLPSNPGCCPNSGAEAAEALSGS